MQVQRKTSLLLVAALPTTMAMSHSRSMNKSVRYAHLYTGSQQDAWLDHENRYTPGLYFHVSLLKSQTVNSADRLVFGHRYTCISTVHNVGVVVTQVHVGLVVTKCKCTPVFQQHIDFLLDCFCAFSLS